MSGDATHFTILDLVRSLIRTRKHTNSPLLFIKSIRITPASLFSPLFAERPLSSRRCTTTCLSIDTDALNILSIPFHRSVDGFLHFARSLPLYTGFLLLSRMNIHLARCSLSRLSLRPLSRSKLCCARVKVVVCRWRCEFLRSFVHIICRIARNAFI